ncbi:hypothetical protein RB195_018804 [Necator americanus]|uniref:Uncharacterized protein n=1 Tax=Necator americanus TaxID=51031 RepID=A0ABR1CD70_NECAM
MLERNSDIAITLWDVIVLWDIVSKIGTANLRHIELVVTEECPKQYEGYKGNEVASYGLLVLNTMSSWPTLSRYCNTNTADDPSDVVIDGRGLVITASLRCACSGLPTVCSSGTYSAAGT